MTSKLGLTGVFTLFVLATLSACGGGGGGGSAAAPPPNNVPRFAFVANFNDNTVSSYTVNPTTGQLRHNGYVAAGIQPHSVTVHPSGKFVYVTNFGGTALSGYAVGSDGRLTSLFAPIGCANCAARGVTIDPTGKYLYIAYSATGANIVSAYVIKADGTLTFIADDFSVTEPFSVTIDPAGRFAYVTSFDNALVHAFAIQANGALSSVDTDAVTAGNQASIAAGPGTHAFTFDPAGRFAYTANNASGNVSAYTVNATTGALTSVGAAVAAGTNPRSVTVDPSGKFAYVANFSTNEVSAYSINASTGALTALAGSPFAAGTNPGSVTVDPSGKFLYVTNLGSSDTTVFTLDAVTGVPGAARTIAGRNGNLEMAMTRGTTAVSYTSKAVYVANLGSNNVSQYTIGTSGALTPMATPTVAAGSLPSSVTVDLLGRFAYVANFSSNDVSAYTIDPVTHALSPVIGSPFAAGTSPTAVSIDSSGRFLYVSNYGWPASGTVSAYTINATTGVLTAIAGSPFAAGGGSSSIDADPAGRFVYVTNLLNGTLSAFSINSTSGILTRLDADPVTVGVQDLSVSDARPVSIAADPTGRFVYVATACGTSWVFGINAASGLLTRVDSAPGGLCFAGPFTPDTLALDPAGRYLYVTNNDFTQVSAQVIDASAGTLTAVAGSPFITGLNRRSVTVDLSGKYAYATASAGVHQFTIGANGALTPMATATVAAGANPNSITTTGTIQ